jgi:hypothetical protein
VVDAVHRALAVHARTAAGGPTRERWLETLARLVDRRDLHGLLSGRITRLLMDAGMISRADAARRFAARLSIGVGPADKAAWVDGFLAGSGLVLVHDDELLAALDAWVTSLGPDEFVNVLPLLRRTFGEFSTGERSNIADQLKQLTTGVPRRTEADEIDPERAAGAVRTVAEILAGDGS